MNIRNILSIAAISAFLAAGAFGQTANPLSTIRAFYAYDLKHPDAFSKTSIDVRKRWISDELYRLFLNELKREKAYLRKNPSDKPYFGDGLPFRPIDETCKIGRRTLHKIVNFESAELLGAKASVKATFAFPKPCKDTDATVYTLELIRSRRGWLIDNVLYEDNHGLVTDLKRKDY